MTPQETLASFILAAKAIIYDPKRAASLLAMFTTKAGAVNAVHAVTGAIGQKKPVPAQIAPLLGVSVLMLLLDLLKRSSGEQPPQPMILEVIKMLLAETGQPVPEAQPEAPPEAPTTPPPAGLINQGA